MVSEMPGLSLPYGAHSMRQQELSGPGKHLRYLWGRWLRSASKNLSPLHTTGELYNGDSRSKNTLRNTLIYEGQTNDIQISGHVIKSIWINKKRFDILTIQNFLTGRIQRHHPVTRFDHGSLHGLRLPCFKYVGVDTGIWSPKLPESTVRETSSSVAFKVGWPCRIRPTFFSAMRRSLGDSLLLSLLLVCVGHVYACKVSG